MAATFQLHELARITGGRITQTHSNQCPALDGGACNCTTAEFRVIRSRPARKGGARR